MRYQFTTADRQKGFRNAVFAVQVKHNLDFNDAVQWLMRKISPNGNWIAHREGKESSNQC